MRIRPLFLATFLIFATGCTHQRSIQVTATDRLASFNAKAAERAATVTLHSGVEHSARALQVTPDSTSWLVPTSSEVVSVPTHEVMDVRFRNRGSGALDGLGLGVVIGGLTGAAIGLISGDDDPDLWFAFTAGEKAAIAGIALGLTGGVIGLVVGAALGSAEVYRVDDQFRERGVAGGDDASGSEEVYRFDRMEPLQEVMRLDHR